MKGRKVLLAAISLVVMTPCLSANADTQGTGSEGVSSLMEWVKQGKASGAIKYLWYYRDNDVSLDASTFAVGGNLKYETAPLYGFRVGAGFKTSQGASWNSDSKAVYGAVLDRSGPTSPENYTAMDEYYVSYQGYDTTVTFGAQSVFNPWIKGFDVYMAPIKYRGLSIKNTTFNVEESKHKFILEALYLDEVLGWTAEEFDSIASGYTKNPEADGGMFAAGVTYRAPGDLRFQLWDYYYEDVQNDLSFEARYRRPLSKDVNMVMNFKYLNRQDTGDAYAGELDTWTAGGDIGVSFKGFTLTGYYGQVGDDRVDDPYGGNKVIIQQAGANLQRPEETGYAVKLDYNFKQIGVEGLTAYTFLATYDTPDKGTNASQDYDQIDFNLQYKLGGWFKGCEARLRYAIRNVDDDVSGSLQDFNDIRFSLAYRF
ncbi:OprD family outer membrane porin [Desulfopila aestuarii]|uniref:Outer membrane porin, OprD family n=1 Tax=Desulfopila aestuarii DSM 18488 TaxID=1121416 RepID=A0A1M7XXZ7_9BACT|nr:OprD family outer membrane porin [Desulfopila aestuarii]SHO43874.1 outer membrane porin, OprD family [Desulfopila aestuarii DSM 18488]